MTQLTFDDPEFGRIYVRTNPRARRLILRLHPDATVHITIPHKRHLAGARSLLDESRPSLRHQLANLRTQMPQYGPGATVGRSHQLIFQATPTGEVRTRVSADKIVVNYPFSLDPQAEDVQAKVRLAVKKALRRQAEAYLPPRLARLATQWGYAYRQARIMSGRTRWGSCSSDGIISLNQSLMHLPEHLIDYVICHELCHTVQHNHSPAFWDLVASHIPNWKALRKELKQIHPF